MVAGRTFHQQFGVEKGGFGGISILTISQRMNLKIIILIRKFFQEGFAQFL